MTSNSSQKNSQFTILVTFITLTLIAALAGPVVLSFWPRFTSANYDRITMSMTMPDVQQLLGYQDYDDTKYGTIGTSGAYITNDTLSKNEMRELGNQKYRRLTWISRELTITVVFDMHGQAATYYRSDGHDSAAWWR